MTLSAEWRWRSLFPRTEEFDPGTWPGREDFYA